MPSVKRLSSQGRSLGAELTSARRSSASEWISAWLGRVEVEHQNGRRDGEEAIAERRDAADLAAGQSVVVGLHGVTIAFRLKRVNPADACHDRGQERFVAKRRLTWEPAFFR